VLIDGSGVSESGATVSAEFDLSLHLKLNGKTIDQTKFFQYNL
jgi:hypothetical protein